MAEDARSGSGGKSSRWKQHKATNPCKAVCEPREQVLLWEKDGFPFFLANFTAYLPSGPSFGGSLSCLNYCCWDFLS